MFLFQAQSEKKLKRTEAERIRSQKRRRELRQTIQDISDSNPDVAAKLRKNNREQPGRPSLETDQPFLHEVILRLASAGAAADGRRRTEEIQACRTLDDLNEQLKKEGFELSRSALYLR